MVEETIEAYRKELRRVAWRIAYRQKTKRRKEKTGIGAAEMEHAAKLCSREAERAMREYMQLIPFDKGRTVMESVFIEGKTEAETAEAMGISQQGVNKWKRKSLEYLRRTLNS